MKSILLTVAAVSAVVGLSSCAGTKVSQTQVTTGALKPKKIFIRPFGTGEFRGYHGTEALKEIRKSQDGEVFANILQEELEKIAPTTVLKPGESPDGGWLVEGVLEIVDGGNTVGRGPFGHFGLGRSGILTHVRISDASRAHHSDGKGGTGATLYEFDVAGGSRLNGPAGGTYSPGHGYSAPFDYRNTAERIAKTINPDRERYGYRASTDWNW